MIAGATLNLTHWFQRSHIYKDGACVRLNEWRKWHACVPPNCIMFLVSWVYLFSSVLFPVSAPISPFLQLINSTAFSLSLCLSVSPPIFIGLLVLISSNDGGYIMEVWERVGLTFFPLFTLMLFQICWQISPWHLIIWWWSKWGQVLTMICYKVLCFTEEGKSDLNGMGVWRWVLVQFGMNSWIIDVHYGCIILVLFFLS